MEGKIINEPMDVEHIKSSIGGYNERRATTALALPPTSQAHI